MQRFEKERAGITLDDAVCLADNILTGKLEIPEMGLTKTKLQKASLPAEALLMRVEDTLSGISPYRQQCLAAIQGMPGCISLGLKRILDHGKCDIAAWLIISQHVSFINLPGPMGGRTVVSPETISADEIIDVHVFLGNQAYWITDGSLDIVMNVPETALAASLGRPLSSLISHPALDDLPFIIQAIDDNGADGHVVTTNYKQWPLRLKTVALAELA